MDKYHDFSVDNEAFPGLSNFADKLHDKQIRMVLIVDPGLSAEDKTNKYYQRA